MEKLRIVFLGTPDFAVGILKNVLESGYEVAAVVTAPDKPAGRGQKIKFSAVKDFAITRGLAVLQPTNLKDPDFLASLKAIDANLQIVVAFRMLPEAVWKMPRLGTFNLHASLLPQYRGAAPINWAIINGESKTGVTTFFIDDKIDTGEIIISRETAIGNEETAGELHERLMHLGAETVIETLHLIETGNVKTIKQPEDDQKTAYKLNRENCRIDWKKPADEVFNLIRGLSPYPAAWCFISDGENEYSVKIYSAKKTDENQLKPGEIRTTRKTIAIGCRDGSLEILELQFPAKKKMAAAELLNGFSLGSQASAY